MNNTLKKRYDNTLDFIRRNIPGQPSDLSVMDLGTPNEFSKILLKEGFNVVNTQGEDLDFEYAKLGSYGKKDFVTALEIFEHLLNPLQVLQNIPSDRIITSIPLSLWFAKAYRSKTDKWDRHFHEFEDWQFDWLLEKAGWKIIASEKWTAPTGSIGFRPMLRKITPRYYIVYAERI